MRWVVIALLSLFAATAQAKSVCEKYKSASSSANYSSGTSVACSGPCLITSILASSCQHDPALNLAIKNQLDPKIGNRLTDDTSENDLAAIHQALSQYQSWIDGEAYEGTTPEKCRVEAYKSYFNILKEKIRARCTILTTERDAKIISETLPVAPKY